MTALYSRTEAHIHTTEEAPSVAATKECCCRVADSREGENNCAIDAVQRTGERTEDKHMRGEKADILLLWSFHCTCSSQRGGSQPVDQKSQFSDVGAQSTATEPG